MPIGAAIAIDVAMAIGAAITMNGAMAISTAMAMDGSMAIGAAVGMGGAVTIGAAVVTGAIMMNGLDIICRQTVRIQTTVAAQSGCRWTSEVSAAGGTAMEVIATMAAKTMTIAISWSSNVDSNRIQCSSACNYRRMIPRSCPKRKLIIVAGRGEAKR